MCLIYYQCAEFLEGCSAKCEFCMGISKQFSSSEFEDLKKFAAYYLKQKQ